LWGKSSEGKVFFFEKKKQKTFATSPLPATRHGWNHAHRKEQKFFGSFFQKRTASLPPVSAARPDQQQRQYFGLLLCFGPAKRKGARQGFINDLGRFGRRQFCVWVVVSGMPIILKLSEGCGEFAHWRAYGRPPQKLLILGLERGFLKILAYGSHRPMLKSAIQDACS
jgi:hypothetical protein